MAPEQVRDWLPRKLVHISGAAFAFIALYDPRASLLIAMAGFLIFLGLEAVKGRIRLPLMGHLYREAEKKNMAYEPLLYLVCIILLLMISLVAVPAVCYASIIVLTVGDGIAGIVGRAVGRHKLPASNKTWEGSLSGLAVAIILGWPFVGPLAIVGAALGMAAEAYTHRLENFSVAFAAFVAMALLSLL